MASSAETYKQMQNVLSQYNAYGTPESTKISQDISAAVNNLAPQYQELAGLQRAAYQAPGQIMEDLYNQFGSVAGPAAMTRLNQMMNAYNTKQATAQSFGDILNQSKSKISDLATSVLNNATQQKSDLLNTYNALGNTYSVQKSAEQAAAQLAQEKAIAAAQLKAQQNAAALAQKNQAISNWNTKLSDVAKNRDSMSSSQFSSNHDALLKESNDLGLGYSSEDIWTMLGNTSGSTSKTTGVSPYYQSISNYSAPKNSLDKLMQNTIGKGVYNAYTYNQNAYNTAPGLTTILNAAVPGLGSIIGNLIK